MTSYSIYRNQCQLYKPMGLHETYTKFQALKDKFNKNGMKSKRVFGGFMVGKTRYTIRRVG